MPASTDLQNTSERIAWIEDLIRSHAGDNGRMYDLLDLSVGRVLTSAVRRGSSPKVEGLTIKHIADWLRAALVNDAPWLMNVDEKGRPKKLLKFGVISDISREADKAMLKAAQRFKDLKLIEGDESLYAELENGFRLVRLLTPAALDRESAEMQHCIGDGGYDEDLDDAGLLYLSLRDSHGKAHATIEIDDGVIVQLQGKQNRPPLGSYIDILIPYIRENGLSIDVPPDLLGHVVDVHGVWHRLENLPSGLEIEGNLDLGWTKIEMLPEGLQVGGDLDLAGSKITTLSDGLTVGRGLLLYGTRITTLPKRLSVGRSLDLFTTRVTTLQEGLTVGGDLHLVGSRVRTLPNGLAVGGHLILRHTLITALPEGLSVGGCLDLSETGITELPEGLSVGGDLVLDEVAITAWPKELHVGKDFHMRNAVIASLPEGLTVGRLLDIRGTQIRELPSSIDDGVEVVSDYGAMTAKQFRSAQFALSDWNVSP